MSSDTTNLPSPTPEVSEQPAVREDVEAATERFLSETAGHDGIPARDPATGRFVKAETTETTTEVTGEVAGEVATEVNTESNTESNSEAEEGSTASESEQTESPDEADLTARTVILKGLADRGEQDVSLVLPDAETAERFNREVNNGLRRKNYDQMVKALESREAEVREFHTALEHNPIGTLLQAIPRDASLEVARALVAEHWDALFPEVQQFAQDPTRVREVRLDSRERTIQADRQAREAMQAAQRAEQVMQAVASVVPDTVTDEIRAAFMQDAEQDLIRLAQQGVAIAPSEVGKLLDRRIQMYGFATQKSPVTPKKPVVAVRSGSTPQAAPSVTDAKQAQARIQKVVQAQTTAAKTPPPGRGAAVVRQPMIPKGLTIEEATDRYLNASVTVP